MAKRIDPSLRDYLATSLAAEGRLSNERALAIAGQVGVSLRTIRRIVAAGRRGECERPQLGRPAFPRSVFADARQRVQKHLDQIGWRYGEGTVLAKFQDAFPRSVVMRVVRELKAKRKRRMRAAAIARRVGFRATAQGALWSIDEAQLAPRSRAMDDVFIEIVRDPATRETRVTEPAPPATGEAAVQWLDELIKASGFTPLVVSTDNGAAYKSEVFSEFLERHKIVHLRNLPHTPQHNAHAERGVKEVKQKLGIPRGTLQSAGAWLGLRLSAAVRHLNCALHRGVLQGRTAAEEAARLPIAETLIDRQKFFAETCAAIEAAVQDCSSARAARLAERKAILQTLARHSLITITRGGKDVAT